MSPVSSDEVIPQEKDGDPQDDEIDDIQEEDAQEDADGDLELVTLGQREPTISPLSSGNELL